TTTLYQSSDATLPESVSYEGFTIVFQPSEDHEPKILEISPGIYIDEKLNLLGELRAFNNAFIKVNADKNADMRMTGSSTLLGRITAPSTAKNSLSANARALAIDPSTGNIGVGNSSFTFTSDVFINQGS